MFRNILAGVPVKDSFWSVIATIIPALMIMASTGVISRNLTNTEFTAYLYILGFLVYLIFFDFGFSKALVYFLSQDKQFETQKKIITNVLFFGSMLSGLLVVMVLFPIVIWYVPNVIEMSDDFIWPLYILLVIVFLFSIIQQYLLSICEGNKDFFVLAKYRIFSAFVTSLIPAFSAIMFSEIYYVILGLAAAKVTCCLSIFYSRKYYQLVSKVYIDWNTIKEIFGYSKGIYASGLVAPFLGSSDRLVIASPSFISHSVVYIPAIDMITKLIMIPSAICKVIFVRSVGSNNGLKDTSKFVVHYYTLSILMAVAYLYYSSDILRLWLGPDANIDPMVALSPIFCIGFLCNSLAQFHCARVLSQKNGPIKVAKVHLIEMPIYMLSAFFMTQSETSGVIYVAVLWSSRMFVDYMVMLRLEMDLI